MSALERQIHYNYYSYLPNNSVQCRVTVISGRQVLRKHICSHFIFPLSCKQKISRYSPSPLSKNKHIFVPSPCGYVRRVKLLIITL